MCNYPLPPAFIENMRPLLGAEMDAFLASYEQPALRGIRFRDERRPLPEEELTGIIPYARNAYNLCPGSAAGASPLHEAGAYYIQEPSAMTAAAVLAPEDGDRVLDLCAAPGGKSTQLAMSAQLALLVSNEPVFSRAQILSRNIERMGIHNAVVTCAYPPALSEKWPQFFDKILVDAPCSGEGMFRRHPETRAEWTIAAPQSCAARQLSILRDAARMLRTGGRMAYSTCTFNHWENEGTIAAFLKEHHNFRLVPFALPGLPAAPEGMLRIWPHKMPGEGHFVALLEKTALGDNEPTNPACIAALPGPNRAAADAFSAFCQETGCVPPPVCNAVFSGKLLSAPAVLPDLSKIRTLRIGLQLGEMRGKVFLPDHAMALSAGFERQFSIAAEQAASYLHGDTLPCGDRLRGYYAVTWNDWQLGLSLIHI